MTEDKRYSGEPDDITIENTNTTEQSDETICRCKDVSKKTLPEMLMLMISDLAFWKHLKRRNKNSLR